MSEARSGLRSQRRANMLVIRHVVPDALRSGRNLKLPFPSLAGHSPVGPICRNLRPSRVAFSHLTQQAQRLPCVGLRSGPGTKAAGATYKPDAAAGRACSRTSARSMSQATIHTDANQQADTDGRYRRQVVRASKWRPCIPIPIAYIGTCAVVFPRQYPEGWKIST